MTESNTKNHIDADSPVKTVKARRLPQLNRRLQAVAELVKPCDCLYDIGSDHGFLPIELIRRGIARRAVASDIGSGPIAAATRNIARFGLQEQIETVVTPGLSGHAVRAQDAVVLAGLGGLEMIDILAAADLVQGQLILQPQKSAFELRRWLVENQYRITQESLVEDRARIYPILVVEPVQDSPQPLTLSEAYLGPCLMRDRPPLYPAYRMQRIRHLQKAVHSQPELRPILALLQEEHP